MGAKGKARTVAVVLTFLAGLYFILDFVVPPTLPGFTREGVVAALGPAALSVRVPDGSLVRYAFQTTDLGPIQVLVVRRDIAGEPKPVAAILRQLSLGENVTVRRGPFPFRDGIGRLRPGERWVDSASGEEISEPAAAESVQIENRNAVVTAVLPGSVTLIQGRGRSVTIVSMHEVVLRVNRFTAPSEVQLDQIRVGDTVRVGPNTGFADNRDTASQFNTVISTMAFGMGLLSLGAVNGKVLVGRRPGWGGALFFFAAAVVGVLAGLYKYAPAQSTEHAFSDFVVLRVISSVTSAVFSLLAFYMATAAYRAFRIRSGEAALMMASALIVMLGQTPFGLYLTSWTGERFQGFWLPNVAAWVLRVPNTAVFRGLIFGVMVGAIATALRFWLSLERSSAMRD